MAKYIINVFKKQVHLHANVTNKCDLRMRPNHRVDTDLDYCEGYDAFKPCPFCYGSGRQHQIETEIVHPHMG